MGYHHRFLCGTNRNLPNEYLLLSSISGIVFITNLVILPGMSIILGLGVVVMIMAAFDLVWMPLLKSLEGSIWILNKIIGWVASFENFIFSDIPLNSYMMWSCYFIIFSTIIWFKKPTFKN